MGPDTLHLLASVLGLHLLIVEAMLALLVLRRPQDRLGGVREVAAGKVRRRVRLLPCDVVQQLEPELLHCVADGEDDVLRAGNPEGAVGLEYALAAAEPFGVELVVELCAA